MPDRILSTSRRIIERWETVGLPSGPPEENLRIVDLNIAELARVLTRFPLKATEVRDLVRRYVAMAASIQANNRTSTLVVVMAFDRDAAGELRLAFEPRKMPDEARAQTAAELIHKNHAGVIAWVRSVNLSDDGLREPEIIARYGDVPKLPLLSLIQPGE